MKGNGNIKKVELTIANGRGGADDRLAAYSTLTGWQPVLLGSRGRFCNAVLRRRVGLIGVVGGALLFSSW